MRAVPEGFHTITPYLSVKGGQDAIAHYVAALGATEDYRMMMPDSDQIMHACLQVGNSKLFLCDSCEDFPAPENGEGAQFYLYVDDVDARHQSAKSAGMTEDMPPTDMFWGDRMSKLTDRYGYSWSLATHTRDVSDEEMAEAVKAMAG